MSVQVRRRREAAAFLASFVGAQGELLVDTTNNRVQVHDGVTPGGWPAAGARDLPGFNLGINTNGAVNQRGVSGTVTLSAGQYGHDRTKGGVGGCTYTFATAADGDTTFTIIAGSLVQAIDVGNVFSTAMWLTWTGTAPARVYQGAASGAPAYGTGAAVAIDGTLVNAILATGLTLGTIALVEFGPGTLNTARPWQLGAALPNAGPTRLARRHGELALCQRYFWKSFRQSLAPAANTSDTAGALCISTLSVSGVYQYIVRLPAAMRSSTPLITAYNVYSGTSTYWSEPGGNSSVPSLAFAIADSSFGLLLNNGSQVSSAYFYYLHATASAEI